jgi:predicted glutamine amidotransferase
MCQLFGMNGVVAPTDFILSFQDFCRRGGDTDIHSHGWGCAIYDEEQGGGGGGLRCFRDTLPAAMSPMARQLVQSDHRIQTHVRIEYCIPSSYTLSWHSLLRTCS